METAWPVWVTCSTSWLLGCPCGENDFPHVKTEHPILCQNTQPLCLILPLCMFVEKPGSVFLSSPCRHCGAADRSPENHLFSRLDEPWSLSFSLQGKCSSTNHCGGPLLSSLQAIIVFPVLGGPKLDTLSRCALMSTEQRGKTTSPYMLAMLLLAQPNWFPTCTVCLVGFWW